MADKLHKLFLFEFLVHSVTFSNSTLKLDPDFLKKLGPTTVQFKANNLPTLVVSEIDFCAKDAFSSNTVKFKSGKSCLFSLGDEVIDDCEIHGEVIVKRPFPPDCKNSSYCVGRSHVCLDSKFVTILNSCGKSPLSTCMKVSLDLKNGINETVGVVRLLIRLTCFGTAIVTEFQKTADDSKGFLFKGDKIIPFESDPCACITSKYSQQQGDSRYTGMISQMSTPKMVQNPMQQFGQMPMQQFRQMPMQQFGQMPMQQFGQMPMLQQPGQMPMVQPRGPMMQPGAMPMMQPRGPMMQPGAMPMIQPGGMRPKVQRANFSC